MSSRYPRHDLRYVQSLDGVWDFAFLGDIDPDSVAIEGIDFTDSMPVPGCFDAAPRYAGRRGLTAYRRRIYLPDEATYRLVFDAVHHWCRLFLDGVLLGEHAGGFTRFSFDIQGHPAGEAELTALVDNRFDEQRSPLHLDYYDWYHYGGITRPVTLHRLGNCWIESLAVDVAQLDPPEIHLRLAYHRLDEPARVPLSISLDGQELLSEDIDLPVGAGSLERRLRLPGASLWSPEQPNLHFLYLRLGEDDLRQRIGLRQVRAEGRQILINNRPIRLLGVNRHEFHPQFGHALPDAILAQDVQLLCDLGCNFVRGSHYPQDERFLDLCDEAGLCVWVEATGWQHHAQHLTDPRFIQAQLTNIEEMVAVARNHPAVILWGILNESQSHDPDCRPGYQALLGRLRELDSTRPLTYATCYPFHDLCLDLVDVVSINAYPGWYHDEIEDIPAFIDQVVARVEEMGHGDKPFLLSEIGADAIYGWRDWRQARWSEAYQAALLDKVIRYLFVERQRFCGLGIWQFCDVRSAEMVAKILGRPRGYNNKGIVDEYRRPKQAYDLVKGWFTALNRPAE